MYQAMSQQTIHQLLYHGEKAHVLATLNQSDKRIYAFYFLFTWVNKVEMD